MLRDECHAGTPAKQLPALAAMSLRKEAQRLTRGEHRERHLQRTAVGLATPDRKCADRAQDVADHGNLEELTLGHVADGTTQRELHPRRVLPVDVVRDEDERSSRRGVLRAPPPPPAKKTGEGAGERETEAPEPEALFRPPPGPRE